MCAAGFWLGNIPAFSMAGDLKAYWNVIDGSNGETAKKAYARGFKPVTILNPYSNFPKQKSDSSGAVAKGPLNPWSKLPSFGPIIRSNIEHAPPVSESTT
ncbi:hypothetical protein [Mesorhizobium sp.]|uniref:hypothetical protein n=1 Tax=Mesorhizobium sp. TaxID=1871066 RepID=UPI00257D8901|nr:hypothetical protein [Mesorhizobium sp.]